MDEQIRLRPGETVEVSGQYVQIVARSGKRVPESGEGTLVQGEPAPPTTGRGVVWRLEDASETATADGASPPCPPLPASAADGAAAGEGGTATANDAVRGNTRRASVRTGQRPADGASPPAPSPSLASEPSDGEGSTEDGDGAARRGAASSGSGGAEK